MTFPSKLIQVHMPPLTSTEVVGSSAKNLTATGSTRSDAYQLKDSINSFSTVTSGTGAKLPACENNCMCVVNNYGASTLTVYPFESSGVTIDGASSFQVAANKTVILFGVQTNWISVYDTSGGGGGGGTAWGSITGTLSDQTDLQTELDAKLDSASVSAFGLTLIDDADASEARTTLGLGTAATSNTGDFAAAAQGALADSALQPADIGVTVQAYDAQLADIAGLTPSDNGVIIGNGTNFVLESGSTLRTSLGLAIGTDVQAYDAQTAFTDVAQTYTAAQRGSITALTDATNIAMDMSLNNFFSVTLGGNRTLDNPTNIVAGQSGSIFITQDGTGSRTLAYGSFWDFAGGTAPTLSTTANAVDRLDYVVRTTGSIHAQLTKAWS